MEFFGHNWKKKKVTLQDTLSEKETVKKIDQQDNNNSFISNTTSYSTVSQTSLIKKFSEDDLKR